MMPAETGGIMKKWMIPAALLLAASLAGGYYLYQRQAEAARQGTLYGNVDIREVVLAFRVSGRLSSSRWTRATACSRGRFSPGSTSSH